MKIKPIIYAKTLVETAGGNNKDIAQRFWANLQKNKQYKDLPKILTLVDEEAAAQDGKKLVRIYSKERLDEKTMEEIKDRLSKRTVILSRQAKNLDPSVASLPQDDSHGVILKNITGKNITGFVAYLEDRIIDLSLETKIKNLKQMIAK